ncbi:DISARM system phospholipase D-like protein DrmC [Micromonospora pisi]|uniref:DISARM system phospholipase D-like protein DrmC n=1 Tax=Micromonospora pisi TaxID=589240 RepID=UPI000EADCC78|nr:DISARM system phospholipase D-like protein DrmC [Micromonospora pisi]
MVEILNQAADSRRKVAALQGFTRIDAPEWEVLDTPDRRRAPLAIGEPTWVPCAEMRGEGIFLRFDEDRIVAWEHQPEVKQREQMLVRAHDLWRAQRQLPPESWPGLRFVLLHTFAHVLIREFALEWRFALALADIAARLPAGHVDAWAAVLTSTAAPDSATEARLIDARPGYAVAAQAHQLVNAWRVNAPAVPGAAVALALRSAAQVHRTTAQHQPSLVINGPTSPNVPVRLTSSVVVEMIRAARESLLIVSFAAYGVTEVITELVASANRGVHIDLVLESSAPDGGALRGHTGAAVAFTALRDRATFWHWPAHQRAAAGNPRAALHAKLIAADTRTALVSSANLTDRALSSNLEVGVVLHDPDLVRRLVRHFTGLMNPRTGPLEVTR